MYIEMYTNATGLKNVDLLQSTLETSVESKIQDQAFNRSSRIAATASLRKAQAEGLAAVQALDPMMEDLLGHDPHSPSGRARVA
jgi:hypothetical protein